jgi:hypothetical protein
MCLVLVASGATAGPLGHKDAPAKLSIDAAREYAEAFAYEREGLFADAVKSYGYANKIVEAPAAYYNIAADELALGHRRLAIRALESYLKLAPPDRAQVDKVIADLKAAPAEVTIGAEKIEETDLRALVLVDGVVVGGSPSTVRLAPGEHVLERIAPGHYDREQEPVGNDDGRYYGFGWRSYDRHGNVVISINDRTNNDKWTEHGVDLRSNAPFELPVGHYKTVGVRDHLCSPIAFDVVATDELTYVHVTATDPRERTCWPVEKVTVQRLLKGIK